MTTASTTITLELTDEQRAALLKLLPSHPRAGVVAQLNGKVRRAVEDADRVRKFMRGDTNRLYNAKNTDNGFM